MFLLLLLELGCFQCFFLFCGMLTILSTSLSGTNFRTNIFHTLPEPAKRIADSGNLKLLYSSYLFCIKCSH